MDLKKLFLIFHLFFILLIGLNSREAVAAEEIAVDEDNSAEYIVLGLIGFNYTDRIIKQYSVNSSGGGHVRLSSPTSGGSGVVCCARILKAQRERIEVKVKWQVDGCFDPVRGSSGEMGKRTRFHYKEATVYLDPPISSESAYLETHFFPDGSVKVRVAEFISLPEIILDKYRKDQSKFLRCKDEKNSRSLKSW